MVKIEVTTADGGIHHGYITLDTNGTADFDYGPLHLHIENLALPPCCHETENLYSQQLGEL